MENSETYLLKRIISSDKETYPTLGELHAKHVPDVAQLMKDFAMDTVIDIMQRIEKGETIKLTDTIQINGKVKRKKK